MAKETRRVHIAVTSNASKDLNKGTVAAKGLSGSLKGVGASANLATGGIKAMTMALLSSGVGAIVLAFGALAGGIGGVITKSKEFEKALSTLEAVTGSSKAEIQQLSDLAKQLGSTTAFTASQVVELQTELAKLGFKTDEIKDSTAAILDLAASLDVDLASAAEFSGSLVKSFGLTTEETARVVDVMALSTSSSALNFEGLRESLKLVAPVAKATGTSIEKTTALLGVLADRGLKGSIAGTGLGQTFVELNKKGLTLEQAMTKVSQSSNKLGTAMQLVGTRGGRALLTLAEGRKDIDKLEQTFIDAEGAAKKMAEIKLDNLAGDTTKLASAWEGLVLNLEDGQGLLNKMARGSVQLLIAAISGLQKTSFRLGTSWDSLVLGFEYGVITMRKIGAEFKVLGKEMAIFAVDAMMAMSDVPIIGGLVDDATLIAKRKELTEELEAANKAINDFSIQQFENERQRDQKNVEYRLGRKLKEYKDGEEAIAVEEEKTKTTKAANISKEEQEAIDAKKAFLAKLKKLEQDTDDTTALEKIQRKRERHLEDLKTIKMNATERAEAVKTIDAIYDAQRDAQIKLNEEKRRKIFDDFTKQFNIESEDPSEKLKQQQEAHLLELETLKLNTTEKEEAVKAIKAFYANEEAVLKENDRVLKQEQDLADLETKRQLISQGLDLAIEASGQESKIGQALFKIKQMMALAEMAMQMKTYMVEMKMNAQKAEGKLSMDAVNQTGALSEGMANAAKLGPPFNAIPMAIMAIQSGLMIKNMMKSKKEMKKITGRFGGGNMGGGAAAPQAPNFNVIGQTSAGENLIADTVAGVNNRPIRAFVVDKDVTSSQELSRNTETIASIG